MTNIFLRCALVLLVGLVAGCSKRSSSLSANGRTEAAQNTQEANVAEPDISAIGDHHVYLQTQNGIEVFDRVSLDYLGRLESRESAKGSTIYARGNQLIILPKTEAMHRYYDYPEKESNDQVFVFEALPGKLPSLKKTLDLVGRVLDSRLAENRLVLVFIDQMTPSELADKADEDKPIRGVACESLAQPMVDKTSAQLSRVMLYNLDDLDAAPQSTAVMGGADSIYMTQKNLYVTKSFFSWPQTFKEGEVDQDSILITKVSLLDGKPAVVGAGLVSGHVKDQWAFKEFSDDEVLVVATSSGFLGGNSESTNHLWSLKNSGEGLAVVGAVHDYGLREDIRAVRYVNNIAYVVTFKKTDPLYAFDLTNPTDPKLLGELKVPGFSTYLHPIGKDRLLGVGFDAEEMGDFAWFQGIQISLFDVTNPLEMLRLDSKVIGVRGSSSDITGDHHAFFFDKDTRTVGIPIVERLGGKGGDGYGMKLGFSGAIFYSLESNSLDEKGRVSHSEMIPKKCLSNLGTSWWQNQERSLDVHRLYKLDSKILALSQYGVSAHSMTDLKKELKRFALPDPVCKTTQYHF